MACPGAGPVLVGYSVSDINAGFYATIAILTALRARDAVTGRGQHIDLALLDTQIASHSHIMMNYLVSGRMPVRAGTASQINVPWQAFPNGRRATGGDHRQRPPVAAFCTALDIAAVAADPRFAHNRDRLRNKQDLLPLLTEALATRTAAEWVEALNARGISSAPVNDFGAVLADPQVVHRGMVQEMDDPEAGTLRFVANPIRMSETPASYDRPPPHLGEHNAEVLQQWLDLDPAGWTQLAKAFSGRIEDPCTTTSGWRWSA